MRAAKVADEEVRPLVLVGSSVLGTEKRLALARPVLSGLYSLDEGGWPKTLRLEDYVPR